MKQAPPPHTPDREYVLPRSPEAMRKHLLDDHYLEGARLANAPDLEVEHRYEHRRDQLAGIEDHTHPVMDLRLPGADL